MRTNGDSILSIDGGTRSGQAVSSIGFHHPYFRFLLCTLLTWRLCAAVLADNASVGFDRANQLYEQGKFAEAIEAYQQLLEEHKVSAALYFNLGNAYFKNGQSGQAIASYRLAQRLAPRDPDVGANLRFARESIAGSSFRAAPWQRWLSLVTLNELTLAVAILVSVFFILLAAGEFRRSWKRGLRPYTRLIGAAALVAAIGLGLAARERLAESAAVVVTREAVVRYGPFEESQSFYTLRDGAELTVLDRKDNWLQVADTSKRIGWVQNKEVLVLPKG